MNVTVELGHVALIVALSLSLVQSILPIWGAQVGSAKLMATGITTSLASFGFIAVSFFCLMWAYAQSDFSVVNVWQNSHSQMPFIYKLSGTWGNHEGSMLLWVLILALFGACVAAFGDNLPARLKANVLSVQGWMILTFLLFIVLTSNPFERQVPVPEGQDLNPILQDIGLAIHPPMLYIGYVGFSVTFSFAVAALIEGRMDSAWARWVRPWTMAAWIFLTAGIAMGSYWAYYELGWGGWWFWDPVENASFLPWLSGTALLHSALVMEKRDALKIWTVLLAIITFSLSLLGTFLVRSGVLTSVHTFASDPTRGLFILAILSAFVGGAFFLFALRSSRLEAGGLFAPISREGALVFNNVILSTAAATVLVGTLYPVVYEALTGAKISVGPPFFNMTFGPLMLPLLLLIPFGPLMAWKRADIRGVYQRLLFALICGIVALVVTMGLTRGGPWLAPVGVGLAFWLIVGSFAEVFQKSGWPGVGLSRGLSRLVGLKRSIWSTAIAHAGVGVMLLGIVAVTSYETETVAALKVGETVEAGDFQIKYLGFVTQSQNNYTEDRAELEVYRDGELVRNSGPAKRFFPARQMPTSEAAIETFGFSQLYISLGEVKPNGSVALRIWWKPQILLIWIGSILMVFAGGLSLSDRKLRIGSPNRAKNKQVAPNAA